ncbi:MAG: NosR/NirI family nitrous oxide reductase transcriptional regulator [Akkermansiaceae bacterium]|jgi:NosR/NirI family nitrous oxide reductase transcriptional regulator
MPKPGMLWVRLYRLAIIATIAFLIFEKSQVTPPQGDFRLLFPEGDRIEGEQVFDPGDKPLGYFLTTSPSCDHLTGYSGPTNVALSLDRTGKLIEARIISSADTPDHLQSVIDDPIFWPAHLGLSLGSPGNPDIDAVSGSTLTSSAISRSIIERLGGLTTSRLFPTDILAAELPEASALEEHPDWPGVKIMYGVKPTIIGYALRTAPSQEYLSGYQGPTDVLIVLDQSATKVRRLRFRKSYDNEDYYERILDDPAWLERYNGMSIDEICAIEQSKIEGVSGATHTSWAIADSVARRLARFESDRAPTPIKIPWRNLTLIALTVGAALFSFTKIRGHPIARILWQTTVVIVLGLILGDLLSQALLLGWTRHGLPFTDSWGLIFLAAAALLVPWASGHQLYCHQLCPHGFLQRWLGKLPVKPIKIPAPIHRFLSHLPSLLLVILIASMTLGASWNLANWEGFDAWLWRSAGLATIMIAIIGLIASIFSPLAYCKYGCPTGALFKFLRKSSGTNRFSLRDLVAGLLCMASFMS